MRGPRGSPAEQSKEPAKTESRPEAGPEAALFAYMSGEAKESPQPEKNRVQSAGNYSSLAILAAGMVLVATPRAQRNSGSSTGMLCVREEIG